MNRKHMETRVAQLEGANSSASKPALMFAIAADDDERTIRGKAEAAAAVKGKTVEDFGMWILLAPLQPLRKKEGRASALANENKLTNETLEQVQ